MIIDNKEIKEKSKYCLSCKIKPCSLKGCPLNNNIPDCINAIKEEKYEKAYEILLKSTVLPSICGRICPHYKQCMGSCVRGIKGEPVQIGELEAFVGDMAIENEYKIKSEQEEMDMETLDNSVEYEHNRDESNYKANNENLDKKNIAIIGGGPSGLTAAAFLTRAGHQVTIYEKYNYLGGLLVHGIPNFRLPKDIVEKSVNKILDLGIRVKYNQELGKNLTLKELEEKYDFIILAFGANVSSKAGIEGEDMQGVYGANELLEYNNHPDYEGKVVVVYGGGNVAMDAARTIKSLGAKKVIVAYRRAREQMPAEQKEVEDAANDGVEFLYQHKIVKIIGRLEQDLIQDIKESSQDYIKDLQDMVKDSQEIVQNMQKKVQKIELIKTKLVRKDGEQRLVPIDIENSNYEIEADYVVMAIGSHPANFVKNLGLELDKKGYIKVDENGQTSNPKIYAIGDLAGNIATVAWAARSGREVHLV